MAEPVTEPRPEPVTQNASGSEQIGDVLASIRRLIAQEQAEAELAAPLQRLARQPLQGVQPDHGRAGASAPSLGPRAERIRQVIEREFKGIAGTEGRLLLAQEERVTAAEQGSPARPCADPAGSPMPLVDPPAREARPTGDHLVVATPSAIGTASPAAADQARRNDHAGTDAAKAEPDVPLAAASLSGRSTAESADISPRGAEPAPVAMGSGTVQLGSPAPSVRPLHVSVAERPSSAPQQPLGNNAASERPQLGFNLLSGDDTGDEDHRSGGDALRHLVREVMLQELQGEIGDRIGRNMRRLVRQELAAVFQAGHRSA